MHLRGGVLQQASLVQFLRRIGHKMNHIHQRVLGREALSGLKYSMGTNAPTVNNMYALAYPDFLVEPKE
jgi:hypothetical protein